MHFKKKRRLYILAATLPLTLVLFVAVYFSLRLAPASKAVWYNDDWTYRIKIPVTAHSGAETNVYFTKTIDTSDTTKFQADCGDLRFTDASGKLLQYYIASGCSSSSTVVHVLVPSFPAGASDYYYYYGNANALNGFESADFTAGTGVTLGSVGSEEKGVGPVGYWAFNEGVDNTCSGGTNDTCDGSGKRNDGAISNGTAWKTSDFCLSGRCLFFDGTNDIVTVTNANLIELDKGLSGGFTWEAWIKPIDGGESASGGEIFSKGTTTFLRVDTLSSGMLNIAGSLDLATTDATVTGTAKVTANQWNHVAMSYTDDGDDEITLWINGVSVATSTNGVGSESADSNNLLIGGSSANNYKGFMDEVKFYNFEKTATQLATDYNRAGVQDSVGANFGQSSSSKALTDGLTGYWKMDESSWTNDCSTATVLDSSGNSNNYKACPNSTGPTGAGAGKYGYGGVLDGTNDYIDGSDDSDFEFGTSTAQLTFSAWIKPTTVPPAANYTILSKYNSNSSQKEYFFYVGTAGKLQLSISSDGSAVSSTSSTTSLTQGVWQHVVATYDLPTNKVRMYINGVLDKENTLTLTSIFTGTASFEIGAVARSTTTPDFFFGGSLDEVRVYKRVLSPKEVQQLYAFSPGPVGYWKLDEKSGTTAFDSSGKANTGTATTNMWVAGKIGGGVHLSGSSESIPLGSPSNLGISGDASYTMEIWAKPVATRLNGSLFACGGATSDHVMSISSDGSGKIYSVHYGNDHSYATSWQLNTWQHVAIVYDASASTESLYINGVLSETWSPTNLSITSGDVCHLGLSSWTGTYMAEGSIDDARLYNYARTSQQVVEDMNGDHPTGGSPIGSYTSYWKMDEGYSTTAHDYNSTNANDLTLSSASWNQTGKVNKAWNGTGSVWLTRADDDDFDFLSSDDFSISMWFKSDSTTNPTNNEYLFEKGTITNTGTAGYAIYADSTGKINFGVKDDTAWGASSPNTVTPDDTATSTADIYDATWHHIVAQKVGTTGIYLYIDGKLNASDTTIAATATLANSISLRVGDDDADSANAFVGDLDEVKIYRSALTQEQVNMDYNAGSGINFGVGASLESSLLTDGSGTAPVAYFKLDEKTGSTGFDSSGNGFTGTLTNSPSWVTGKYGSALRFVSASSQDINFGATNAILTNSSSWSFSFWVKRNTASSTVSSDEYLLSLRSSAGTRAVGVNFRSADNTLTFEYRDSGATFHRTALATLATIADNWQHVEATYNGTSYTVYLNGILKASPTDTFLGFGSGSLRLGSDSGSTPASATVDEARFYGYARTPSQVAYDYNRGRPVGWWKMDECQGSTANDSSGTGNNATLTYGGGTYTQVGTCTSGTSSDAWYGGATGKFNASLAMDSTTDTISIGNVTALAFDRTNPFSLSVWVKTTNTSSQTLFSKQDSSAPFSGWNLQSGLNGSITFQLVNTYSSNALENQVATSILEDGNWHMVTATYDGSSTNAGAFIYLDGRQLATTSSIPSTLSGSITNSISAYIGSRNGTAQKFVGQVDDVRAYNYALSATQVKKLYANDASAFFGPLTGSP